MLQIRDKIINWPKQLLPPEPKQLFYSALLSTVFVRKSFSCLCQCLAMFCNANNVRQIIPIYMCGISIREWFSYCLQLFHNPNVLKGWCQKDRHWECKILLLVYTKSQNSPWKGKDKTGEGWVDILWYLQYLHFSFQDTTENAEFLWF